ncbi:unnamed protein product [Sympodiomycopsis kandeliae]
MVATPAGSRSSSLAASRSREPSFASYRENSVKRSSAAIPNAPRTSTPQMSSLAAASTSSNIKDAQSGCEHLSALPRSQLKVMLKRYAMGIRWGKKVRRGLVQSDEDQQEEEYDAERAAYHGTSADQHDSHHNGKSRKQLLPFPTCSTCQLTLHKPYLCLDCAFVGCPTASTSTKKTISKSCIARHLSDEQHAFAFGIHSGHLYCAKCHSGIQDPRFDALFHREKARTMGRSVGPLQGEEDFNSLCKLPSQTLSTRVPRGIHNLGATCFLSVILQSFLHNPILRNFFLADRHNSELCYKAAGDSCMACEVDLMFRDFFLHDRDKSTHPNDPWIPNSFLFAVWKTQESSELSQSGQQDSHELYISALNTLHSALTAPGRDPKTRKPEIPQWPNENEHKGLPEDKIRQMEAQYGIYSGPRETPPEFVNKLCDCIIHRTFSGVLQSDVRCLVCGYRSSTHDPVLDLSVDLRPPSLIAQQQRDLQAMLDMDGSSIIENEGKKKKKKLADGSGSVINGSSKDGKPGKDKTKSAVNGSASSLPNGGSSSTGIGGTMSKNKYTEYESQDLIDCLRRYCSSEQLPPSSYSCPQCGPIEASKQLSLCRLPPVLSIQLKRFEHTPMNSYKIETRVKFPLKLDLQEFVTPSVLEKGKSSGGNIEESIAYDEYVYDLFCVIVHEGTLNTGHYWCFCKWQDQWYKMNDTDARPAKVEEVFENAYQLMYVRSSLENVVCP